jgi:hypothetical protein
MITAAGQANGAISGEFSGPETAEFSLGRPFAAQKVECAALSPFGCDSACDGYSAPRSGDFAEGWPSG